ncbi:MAG: peptidoglycan DD-metalloendopeptidase family protein [Legionella sp.]
MMLFSYKISIIVILLFFVGGCSQRQDLAPVVESNWHAVANKPLKHVVLPGETLYAISFHYDLDYRKLANINRLDKPYTVKVGQVLYFRDSVFKRAKPARLKHIILTNTNPIKLKKLTKLPLNKVVNRPLHRWLWPANGHVINGFQPQQGKKGLDIVGKKGEQIHAAAAGVVAYAGNGLKGYGNLIIIKHDDKFLTAYGNNARNLVHDGQPVKAGQIIADMGMVDGRFWQVHFEMRKAGVPVNPLNYLQKP